MSLRRFAVLCSLLVLAVDSSVAESQAPPRRPTIAERISAFGRGLTGSDADAQPVGPTQPEAAASRSTAFPQVDGRSLLPSNIFGRSPQPSQHTGGGQASLPPRAGSQFISKTNGTPNAAAAAQQPWQSAAPPAGDRVAVRPPAELASENNAAHQLDGSLPGLGGSPLPSSAVMGNAGRTDDGTSPAISAVEPFIPTETARPAQSISSRPSPLSGPAAPSAARQSPQPRTPMHVDASELRHELAGSFPAGEAGDPAASASLEPSPTAPTVESDAKSFTLDAVHTLPTDRADSSQNERVNPPVEPRPITPIEAPAPQASAPPAAVPVEPIALPQPSRPFTPTTAATGQPQPTAPLQPITPALPQALRRSTAAISASKQLAQVSQNDPNLLVSNRTPVITSDIRGPKQILVGREATFRVHLQNQGEAAAEGVDVVVRVPSWADIIDTTASAGSVTQAPGDTQGTLHWQLPRLEARSGETIDLRLVPRGSRPLELGVTWTLAPVGSRAVVEVQEPKLEMNVAGPDEVLFGKPQLYRFTISNPGTGVAEGVKIELYPPGGGDKPAASNPLPDLAPGKSQSIEVELVAREAGKLSIKAVASAAGDLTCDTMKEVFCRKPELALDWRGPEMKYAGTEATYFIRVRNPGTAPAENVTVKAVLPEGAQLTTASEGQTFDAAHREVSWRVGSLGPGDDSYMELKCTVNTPGANQLNLEATTAAGDLADKKLVETKVVALADLKLDVSDPSGPVAIGEAAVYEIRVQNRGASAAKDVNVVGLFSAGVEPDVVDGPQYSVSNGRVSFRPIDELPAGRQVTLKIRAHGVAAGTHIFRAEVLCRELETKLAAEETTLFYADDSPDTQQRQANSSNGFDTTR